MTTSEEAATHACHHLAPFQMYQWQPNPALTNDENYMDMVLLMTRNSTCNQGHMACAIVKSPSTHATTTTSPSIFYDSILAVGINGPIYAPNDSDIHAEIATISNAAKYARHPLGGSAAYITMPPCKTCFGALVTCGISRIVTLRPVMDSPIRNAATQYGIVLDTISHKACQQRVLEHVNSQSQGVLSIEAKEAIQKARKERREGKKRKYMEKHEQRKGEDCPK